MDTQQKSVPTTLDAENTVNAAAPETSARGRAKKEFKRQKAAPTDAEEASEMAVDEPTNTSDLANVVPQQTASPIKEPIAALESISVEAESIIEPASEAISVEIEEKSTDTLLPASSLPLADDSSAMAVSEDLEVPENINAHEEVTEAMQQKRQLRAKKGGRAKKSEAAVPVLDISKPAQVADDPWRVDDVDFGVLDEAVLDAFSPRKDGDAEAREHARRLRAAAEAEKYKKEDTDDEGDEERKERLANAAAAHAARVAARRAEFEAAERTAIEARAASMEVDESDEKDNKKKRGRDSNVSRSSIASSSSSSSSSSSGSSSSSSSKSSRSSSFASASAAVSASSSSTTPAKVSSPDDEDLTMEAPSPKRACLEEPIFASGSSESPRSIGSESDFATAVVELEETKTDIAIEEESLESAVASPIESKEANSNDEEELLAPLVSKPAVPMSNSQRFALLSETPSKSLKRVSDAIAIAPRPTVPAPSSRVSTSAAPAAPVTTNGLTPLASANLATASRLNERIQRIQNSKAEKERERELERLQKEKERESDKEKIIRHRLDMVRRQTSKTTLSAQAEGSASTAKKSSDAAKPSAVSRPVPKPAVSAANAKKTFEERRNANQVQNVLEQVIQDSRLSITSVGSPSPVKSVKKTAAPRAVDLVPWPPAGVPEIRTPPTSPGRITVNARTPPSLANASALKLKKSTPRRFLPGLMAKDKTPAAGSKGMTPSRHLTTPQHYEMGSNGKMRGSSTKKGFWGNLFGMFSNKKEGFNDSASLISDSPLFVPNAAAPLAASSSASTVPKLDFGSPTTLKSTTKREEASWSPLIMPPPPTGRAEVLSESQLESSASSVEDGLLMPSSATNGVGSPLKLPPKMLEDYRAGIRSVPLLDSTSDDEDDSKWFEKSDDEEEEEAPKVETFEIRAGTSSTAPTSSVTDDSASKAKEAAEYKAAVNAMKTPEKLKANPFWSTPETQVLIVTPRKGHEDSDDDEYDSEDDNEILERHRRRKPAMWTKTEYLRPILESQYSVDPEDVFGNDFPATCDLTDIFSEVKTRIMSRARTSSAFWTRDKLTLDEKREYKRRMGFTVRSLEKEERR